MLNILRKSGLKTDLSSFVIILFSVLILFGTLTRLFNLFNLGSYFDLVVTQYDWGKYQFENGIYNFWKNYDKTFDYMPGAYYLDAFFYSIAKIFGGTDQQFVTVVKIFNWSIDAFWAILVYFVAKNSSKSKSFSVLIAACAYAIPSVWVVTGVWGQMDSLVALLGIISIYFYYFAQENLEDWPFSKSWYSSNRKYFVWISAFLFALGYAIKPNVLLVAPMIGFLILQRKDWYSIVRFVGVFLILCGAFFLVPFLADSTRLIAILKIPFSAINPSRGAANIWYLLDIEKETLKILFDFGFIKIPLLHLALVIFFGFFFYYIFRRFRFNIKNSMQNNLNTFYQTKLSLLDLNILYFILTSAYFIFYLSVHSRYYMPGMLISFLMLATWKNMKNFKTLFVNIFIIHIAFFINQIWLLQNQNPRIEWVDNAAKTIPWNGLKLAGFFYVVCFLTIYIITLNRIEYSEE